MWAAVGDVDDSSVRGKRTNVVDVVEGSTGSTVDLATVTADTR